MKTLVITKVFSDGTIKISSKQMPPRTSIMETISYLDYLMNNGVLCSYEVEIIKGDINT